MENELWQTNIADMEFCHVGKLVDKQLQDDKYQPIVEDISLAQDDCVIVENPSFSLGFNLDSDTDDCEPKKNLTPKPTCQSKVKSSAKKDDDHEPPVHCAGKGHISEKKWKPS